MQKAMNLKQLSKISGYSISTVSKALKDRSDISKEAKNKIKKLANSYDYVPNNTASALRLRRTNIIAVVVPEINNIIYCNIVSSIQKIAHNAGYRVVIQQCNNLREREVECVNNFRDGCVDGVVVIQSSEYYNLNFKGISVPNVINILHDFTLTNHEYNAIGVKIIKKLLLKIYDSKTKL